MLSLSPVKILIIVAVVVILLGPDKLPEVAHKLGTYWQTLRRFQQRVESEVRGALPDLPSTGDIARMARSPLSALNELADRVDRPAPPPDDANPPPASSPLITPVVNPPTAPPSTGNSSADPSLN
jgi:Sec-independent protein translocase protein TatA